LASAAEPDSAQVRSGGSAETARVSVGTDSRGGVHFIETYDVSVTPSGSGTLFQNRHLTLMLSEGRPRSDTIIEYDATLPPSIAAAPSKTVWDAARHVDTA
jgi:hypothetical protein